MRAKQAFFTAVFAGLLLSGCPAEKPESSVVPQKDAQDNAAPADTKTNEQSQEQDEIARLFAQHQPFDFDFQLSNVQGGTVSLDDFQGRVVIVDIWGTWCGPCRLEVPHFVDLYDKYHDQGLEIVGINYERGSNEEAQQKVREFQEDYQMPYPCVLGDAATKNQVPNFQGYPTTLFVDRAGVVRLKLVGYRPYEQLEAIVQRLLKEESRSVASARP